MSPNNVATVTEAELDDLRRKFQLLEGDRKAYYEMSMKTMKENKRTIAELRENNKSLRKDLSHIQREAGRAAKLGAITEEENELAKLEREISRMRRNHDTLKNAVDKKRGELKRLRDKARDLELESTKPNEENSPLTQKIRVLENRLDKAMIKYNEAQSIRRTYEQIVKRLKDERVGFDNQLAAIERTLQAKQHDYEELLLLSGDANHAKDVAIQEVERMRTTLSENRRTRERDLREKKDLVNLRHDMASRMENMEKMRQDLIAKAAGDLSEKEEKNLKKTLVLNKITQQKITEENNKKQDMIDVFEIAFRKIKDATGVSDVNEVIQKIISQEDTQNNLVELTKENQNKIESLQSEKQRLKARVEEIKYSGHGGGHRRKVVDEHEEKITLALASMDRAKTKFERLARILINVKAGIEHLSEKLDNVKDDGKQIVLTDDTIADVLYQCESTLTSLLQKLRSQDADADGRADQDATSVFAIGISDAEVMQSRPFNQRVILPAVSELDGAAEEFEGDVGMEDVVDGDDEEELTRERIKKASQSLLGMHDKKAKRKQKKKSIFGRL